MAIFPSISDLLGMKEVMDLAKDGRASPETHGFMPVEGVVAWAGLDYRTFAALEGLQSLFGVDGIDKVMGKCIELANSIVTFVGENGRFEFKMGEDEIIIDLKGQ